MSLPSPEQKRLSKEDLSQDDIDYFRGRYGKRFVRALRAVEEGRVFKYCFRPSDSAKWMVKGKRREYLLIPETFCTCRDFYQAVVIDQEAKMCYHLFAQKIAELRGLFTKIDASDAERRKLYTEWRKP
jgi:predicted nucleic acid-binding Zn finger protein